MEKITRIEDVSVQPCTNSRYVQPYRVAYKQVGLGLCHVDMVLVSFPYLRRWSGNETKMTLTFVL